MPDFDIRSIAPYLTHGGLGLLQRGDPFANLQRGLLIGGQLAEAEEQKKLKKKERERIQAALAKIAAASREQRGPVRASPARGPSTPPPGPASAPPNFRLDQGGAANLGLLRRNQEPATALDRAIAAGGGATGTNQGPLALAGVPDEALVGMSPRLPQAPVPPTLMPPGGQAAPAVPVGGLLDTAPGGPAGPPGAPPQPPQGLDPVVSALLESGIPSLVSQGAGLYGQRLSSADRQALQRQAQGFTASQADIMRDFRASEAQRTRNFTAEQKNLDRVHRQDLAEYAAANKRFLEQVKRMAPKDASEADRNALAGAESMIARLDTMQRLIGSGRVDPSSFWATFGATLDRGTGALTSSDRLSFENEANGMIQAFVQATKGQLSDRDVKLLESLIQPRLFDSEESYKSRFVNGIRFAREKLAGVLGKTPEYKRNPEQHWSNQLLQQLDATLERVQTQPGFRGFSDIAGQVQAPTQQMPQVDFSRASRDQIGGILPAQGF